MITFKSMELWQRCMLPNGYSVSFQVLCLLKCILIFSKPSFYKAGHFSTVYASHFYNTSNRSYSKKMISLGSFTISNLKPQKRSQKSIIINKHRTQVHLSLMNRPGCSRRDSLNSKLLLRRDCSLEYLNLWSGNKQLLK